MLVEPGWTVTIRLQSQTDSHTDSSADSGDVSNTYRDESEGGKKDSEGKYAVKIKYTIDYHEKDPYGRSAFLYSTSSDNSVVLETSDSKARTLPVLEEKISITFYQINNSRQKPTPNRGPKLEVGDRIGRTRLYIHSPFLLNALRAIIKYSSETLSGDNVDQLKEGVFPHPYGDLFYHKQELSDYRNDTTGLRSNHTLAYNEECNRHIDLLLKYLDREPNIQIKELEAKWAKKVPTTTFAGFWLLLKPGSDVYVRRNGQLNAYVVEEVLGGVEHFFGGLGVGSVRAQNYSIRVWNLKYDGKVVKRKSEVIDVPVFDNERDIISLPLFPTRFKDKMDDGVRRKQLIERGKKVFRFAKSPAFLEYTGVGLKPGWRKYNRTRVVVEHESQPWDGSEFESLFNWDLGDDDTDIGEKARTPRCECSSCINFDTVKDNCISVTFGDYDAIDPKETENLSEHQYLLCMSHMFGFIFKDRAYDLLDVSGLDNPRMVENAIDQLVMRPETNKDTIKAIVKTYADSSGQAELFSADFIHGKGEGQIFLLHGPPGTGKTLTAESVAEYTKRPLLSITAADLGDDPVKLEKNLLRFFKDANSWDAIVLLDEADVYLERRSVNDLKRNSIVSIFLRALEYFQGILFLTTNRVGQFDEAFMSRIHVSIGYERLDDSARGQIWDNLFRKLKEDHKHGGPEIIYEYDAKEYVKKNKEVKTLEWNGREIRNAFQTAVALAIYDSKMAREKGASVEDSIPEIKEKHLSQIVSMSSAFKDYITSTHEGVKDADLAYRLGLRDDKFGKQTTTDETRS
ncbi:P-loop containing nucleoside triphosphate hydrolase protein [Hyaloscypha bicolor E]|uniref:P-loop containing nucleoside triphosphate hydrolase protein n=1 Tax=Hyaloscypha bicolor E TaxID=1095630 RepID=A0A2J6SQ22_9HELO|nr:P-loop containing nucleoside triphosphate hydrolase protein [Hyaloscypha bicolor E]PMD52866.1 P-loop containing nucleoside triphosphate hydrolase protein [Hyaloscypha bicolor E]